MKVLTKTSTIFIISGVVSFFSKNIGVSPGMPMGGVNIQYDNLGYILGSFFIIIGIILKFKERNKRNTVEYTKCPECKKTYFFSDLEKGICPKCNIETIDIEKYY
ncbi:hypothetical protein Arnit_2860 [Arcobacter nitrofigilis DSM 7299]|jgi:hypothetical protein|uniref:Uncharacterized protein n=1 Tax=Arcobacter nitrofigilis (strain ATCC 33309 / DSM 7299 / CCUG 15893 / LMG 7604 / NCTC 12251 / CI) TaxID=572480 RepID=D5V788_ARCNC|nr:hypothetical protein [Arcobacter nitrofigilis]ADG94508.1 hypothetical protein Arnit_2860 [Arcobacter nitrofigilis DSM 7299]